VERLGLRGAAHLVGDVGVPLGGTFGDDLERKREELDRPRVDLEMLKAQHGAVIDHRPRRLRRMRVKVRVKVIVEDKVNLATPATSQRAGTGST
jgi:hypothetical protein